MRWKDFWHVLKKRVLRSLHKIIFLVFKSLNSLAPPYLSDLLSEHRPIVSLRSSNQRLLRILKSKLKSRGDRAFSVAAPRLWNALPSSIRFATSISVIKSRLKTYLFELAYGQWWNLMHCVLNCFYDLECDIFTVFCIGVKHSGQLLLCLVVL